MPTFSPRLSFSPPGRHWYTNLIALSKVHHPWGQTVVRGIFANWLVGIATWQANAAQVRGLACQKQRQGCWGRGALLSTEPRESAQRWRSQEFALQPQSSMVLTDSAGVGVWFAHLQDLSGKAIAIWLPISAFAMMGGLEHCIANMVSKVQQQMGARMLGGQWG